jgi:hypothetical protein
MAKALINVRVWTISLPVASMMGCRRLRESASKAVTIFRRSSSVAADAPPANRTRERQTQTSNPLIDRFRAIRLPS